MEYRNANTKMDFSPSHFTDLVCSPGGAFATRWFGIVISSLLQNWNGSDASPRSRGGISCTHSGRLRNITLSAQIPMLEGNISTSLGKLRLLESLMLDQNMLFGSVPPKLGNLNGLTMLVLFSNRLTGRIPPQLDDGSNLVQLRLDGNMLSRDIPESLGNLKDIESYNLFVNILLEKYP